MTRLKSLLGAVLAFVLLSQCRAGQHYVFQGYVYDGVTRAKLTTYTIELEYGPNKVTGKVDANGRYTLEGLMDKFDYTIRITAGNYRAFESYNAALTGTDPYFQNIYMYRNAFVFPNDAQTPAYAFGVRLIDSEALPSGRVQFVPTATTGELEKNQDLTGATVFVNHLDASTGVLVKDYSMGRLDVAAGELKFGVPYHMVFFGVDGYGYDVTATFNAGLDSAKILTLKRLDDPALNPLQIIAKNNEDNSVAADTSLVITFNQTVEFAPDTTVLSMEKAIEAATFPVGATGSGFVTSTGGLYFALKDGQDALSTMTNTVKPENATGTAYGVHATLDGGASGTKLTISFTGLSAVISSPDPKTDFCKIVWAGLGSVSLRPKAINTATRPASALTGIAAAAGTSVVGATEPLLLKATNNSCTQRATYPN